MQAIGDAILLPAIGGIHHANGFQDKFRHSSPDLMSSSAFYRDVLGFTVHTISDPGWLFYMSGDCTIMAGHCPDAIPPRKLGDHSYFAYLEIDVLEAQEIKETGRCEAALVPWAYQENDPERVLSGSIPSH